MTGNEMFEMVKEECEKYFEKLKKRKGVLFFINRNRKLGWYEDGVNYNMWGFYLDKVPLLRLLIILE